MKRFLLILLAALLLCGCQSVPEPTETVGATAAAEPPGTYLPGSEVELQTGGAVRAYPLNLPDVYGVAAAGEDLLIFSGSEETVLTLLKGEGLYKAAACNLGGWVRPEDASFHASAKGITWYDPESRSLAFLDGMLKQTSRIAVPEELASPPILSSARTKLYYCTAEAVRELDLETGIDRLLREIAAPGQYLSALLLEDSLLCCVANGESLYIRTDTGELLHRGDWELALTGQKDLYYADVPSGHMHERLFGLPDAAPTLLTPADPFAQVIWLEDLHGALTVENLPEGLRLDYYDLATGLRSGSVELPGLNPPCSVLGHGGYVWFVAESEAGAVLYRWDPALSPSGDETVYTSSRYTLDYMDEAGLEACRAYASELSGRFGVELRVGMDAVKVEPWDYELYPEYQVPVVRRALERMERLLEGYPAAIFDTLSRGTVKGPVKICLVREAVGSPESGSLTEVNGIQFWVEDEAYVVIVAGELLEQTFIHEMFHVIETQVFSNSNAWYEWDSLNPADFTYDYNYVTNLDRDGSLWLEGENRAFIDTYSMSYPKEDRARIMEYASVEGNDHYFESPMMQRKLEVLCRGIREAFGLEGLQSPLPWERYLTRPMA